MKKLLLAILLFVAFNASAQTKYDYATVSFVPLYRELEISIKGKEHFKTIVAKEEVKGFGDVSAAYKEIEKLENDGWELFDTDASNGSGANLRLYTFVLRRKKA